MQTDKQRHIDGTGGILAVIKTLMEAGNRTAQPSMGKGSLGHVGSTYPHSEPQLIALKGTPNTTQTSQIPYPEEGAGF